MLFPCYVDFWHFWSMLCNILFILVLYGCLVAVCLGVWPSGTCKWVLEAQLLASLVHWSYFTRGHVHHFTWNPGCFYMFIILLETLVVFTCSSFYLKPWLFLHVHHFIWNLKPWFFTGVCLCSQLFTCCYMRIQIFGGFPGEVSWP